MLKNMGGNSEMKLESVLSQKLLVQCRHICSVLTLKRPI